jgi:chemotaxis response regulator CheB
MAALAAGAVAIITKPKLGLKQFLVNASDDMVTAVKAAAKANVRTSLRWCARRTRPTSSCRLPTSTPP